MTCCLMVRHQGMYVMIELANLVIVMGLAQQGAPTIAPQQHVYVPETSIERPGDAGLRSHTNFLIYAFPGYRTLATEGMTPAMLKSVYNLPATGGSGIIAIVDAYDYPTALNDFNVFSQNFGFPVETSTNVTASTNKVLQVVNASGSKPSSNQGWAMEESLDIEYAHAMAPNAKIILVEAASNSNSNLYSAVTKAAQLVAANGGKGEVSMSWGASEYFYEALYDGDFQKSGVVFFASTGDNGGKTEYPSTSPYVVGVGGTTINLNADGSFASETGWSGSGGGISSYEARPSYQSVIQNKVGSYKGVPDISFDADPASGAYVYDTTPYNGSTGWWIIGGTSLACPCVAGVSNLAGLFESSSFLELGMIYGGLGTANFRDIVTGTAGSFSCGPGWDEVTGVGSPLGLVDK